MKILLTGATGFVGSYVLEGLLADGHILYLAKRSFSKTDRIKNFLKECKTYNIDQIPLEEIYKDNSIECLVHCATYYGRDDKEYIKNVESNLLFPLKLMNCGIKYGVRNFVNTDSFFCNQIKSEMDLSKVFYMSGYTLAKEQFRQWGEMLSTKHGVNFINLKLEHAYGEKDDMNKFVPYVIEQCRNNIPILDLSEGNQERDFVYVRDVANAYRVVVNSLIGQTIKGYVEYGVGTGRVMKLREFVEIIHKALKSDTLLNWGAISTHEGEIITSRADNVSLKRLGWMPDIVENEQIEHVFANWVEGKV